jgi:Pup amidohydrolase
MDSVPIVGIETEYSLILENQLSPEPAAAARLFFDLLYPVPGPAWDYKDERPSQDARGWLDLCTPVGGNSSSTAVSTTGQSVTPSAPSQLGTRRPKPTVGELTIGRYDQGLMLSNGARFYIDHTHPEYSTPECASLRDLVACDTAGQVFLARAAAIASANLPAEQRFTLYRNNTNYHGASFGCHENYLLGTDIYTDLFGNRQHRLFTYLLPFLITRQIYCGAGKVGSETGEPATFQISQRADFMESAVGLQTVSRRPLVNTRDEPHADARKFRRLHLILGDANMAELSTFLKLGTTRLILQMLEAGWVNLALPLANPVTAMRAVSRDLTCHKNTVELEAARPASALDIQFRYLAEARRFLDARTGSDEQEIVWAAWQEVLQALADDPDRLGRQIDWIIKRQLLEGQIERRGSSWDAPLLKELDLRYHAIDPGRSLYHLMLQRNMIERLVTDDEVNLRLTAPPANTRAALRARLMEVAGPLLVAVSWGSVTWRDPVTGAFIRVLLPDPADPAGELTRELAQTTDLLATIVAHATHAADTQGVHTYELETDLHPAPATQPTRGGPAAVTTSADGDSTAATPPSG